MGAMGFVRNRTPKKKATASLETHGDTRGELLGYIILKSALTISTKMMVNSTLVHSMILLLLEEFFGTRPPPSSKIICPREQKMPPRSRRDLEAVQPWCCHDKLLSFPWG